MATQFPKHRGLPSRLFGQEVRLGRAKHVAACTLYRMGLRDSTEKPLVN